jgi:uncharacterized membrane protein YozB (DUF420 family)
MYFERCRMTNQFASAMLTLVFAAVLLVAGQFYIEKGSARIERRVVAATLDIPKAGAPFD